MEGNKKEESEASWAQDLDKRLGKVTASATCLVDRLEKLPGLIELTESELYDSSCEISNVKMGKELIESRIMGEITREMEVFDGEKPPEERRKPKPKFSNEAARNAELLRREKFDDAFKDIKAREEAVHKKYEAIKRRLHLCENMFSGAKWLTKLLEISASESNKI